MFGGSFGCLAGFESRGASLVKKRSPVSEKEWSKGVENEEGSWSNFLGPVGRVLRLGLRSFRVVGLLGDTCEKSWSCPIVARLRHVTLQKLTFCQDF
jgi:hypothetical protein